MLKSKFIRFFSAAAMMLSVAAIVVPGLAADAPKTVSVAGKSLKLLGSGLREFLFVDIYELHAYSESGSCSTNDIINKEEVKALYLVTMRDIPIGRLKSNLKSTFEKNLPSGDSSALQKKIDSFLAMFTQDLPKGARVEIAYVPGTGTKITIDGKAVGSVTPGSDFGQLIWRSYFGSNPASKGLKEEILEGCGK